MEKKKVWSKSKESGQWAAEPRWKAVEVHCPLQFYDSWGVEMSDWNQATVCSPNLLPRQHMNHGCRLKQNPTVPFDFIYAKIPHSLWHPLACTRSMLYLEVAARQIAFNDLLCWCFVAESEQLAAWLTFDVPLDAAAVLQAQSVVQLLQDYLQLVDLSHAGQGHLLHGQVHIC